MLSAAVRVSSGCRVVYCWWLLAVICPAAPAQYRFDSWTADTGLPQNSVLAIHQTRDGYLWLATSGGLVRFDGVRFTVFNKGNSPGITSNRFNCFYEDAEGALWIGTENGGVTRYARGVFTTYTTENGLPNNFVRGITGDEAGRLWVLSADRIMLWQAADGKFLPDSPLHLKFSAGAPSYGSLGGFWGVDGTSLYRFAHGRLTAWTRADGLPSLDILRRRRRPAPRHLGGDAGSGARPHQRQPCGEGLHRTGWFAEQPAVVHFRAGVEDRVCGSAQRPLDHQP